MIVSDFIEFGMNDIMLLGQVLGTNFIGFGAIIICIINQIGIDLEI